MNAADVALARADWQPVVFAVRPRRLRLLELQPRWPLQTLRVSVLRNHAVEPALSLLDPFLAYAGFCADVSLSGYDDALNAPPRADADVHLVWLDASRYGGPQAGSAADALGGRLRELRGLLSGSILLVEAPRVGGAQGVNTVLRAAAERLPDVHLFPYELITAPLGDTAIEARSSAMGTFVSGEAAVLAAQHLGLLWIPALVRPRLKAVVVDLDHTLIGGVLGEDGVEGVVTAGGYAPVRDALLHLHGKGVLLTLVTKNDPVDVQCLFTEREELIELGRAFAAVEASWRDKAESVRAALLRLHIDLDSVVVIDDNPGEVASMASALRDPWFVVARDPELTACALTLHPGLLALRDDALGARRAADLRAAEHRAAELNRAADPVEYVRSLQLVAQLRMDARDDLTRMSELSRKTNQFNTALARLSETEVERYVSDPERRVVSIRLRDRLSDSGMIGVVFAHRQEDTAVIDEISVSCRALGRSVEGVLIEAAISRIAVDLGCPRVAVPFTPGRRNEPALAWLNTVADVRADGTYGYRLRRGDAGDAARCAAVDLRWEDEDVRPETA